MQNKYALYGDKIDRKILAKYQEAESSFLINTMFKDTRRKPFEIPLPECPAWDTIEGFGLPIKEQYFRSVTIPENLVKLNNRPMKLDKKWDELDKKFYDWNDDIMWMKEQIRRCYEGHWVYIHGVPTFIDPDHYEFLNFWKIDIGLCDYRDADRKWFITHKYFEEDPAFIGTASPKRRKRGETAKVFFKLYKAAKSYERIDIGMQSKDHDEAKKLIAKHLLEPFSELIFFLKPNNEPKNDSLTFVNVVSKTMGIDVGVLDNSLNSYIGCRSGDPQAYNSTKLFRYYDDEPGNVNRIDVNLRWNVAKSALMLNPNAFSYHTSSTEAMCKDGKEGFFTICENSHLQDINEDGKTASGLALFFQSAVEGFEYDGMEFIGKYGESIIDNPTDEQWEFMQKRFYSNHKNKNRKLKREGCLEYLERQIEILRQRGNGSGLSSLIRKLPIYYESCWWEQSHDSDFDVDIMQTRSEKLRHNNPYCQRGNFQWEGKPYRSRVIWVTDENGRWINSDVLNPNESNKQQLDHNGLQMPTNCHRYAAGADTFGASKVKDKKPSDGGGCVIKRHDPYKDKYPSEGGIYADWESYRIVCTYLFRPDTLEEYGDDMAMMTIYYGCEINGENNIDFISDHFKRIGLVNYLFYKVNKETNKWEERAGIKTTDRVKDEGWAILKSYIFHHGCREKHLEFLEWCTKIRGKDELTDFDGLASVIHAFLNDKYSNTEYDVTEIMESHDISAFVEDYEEFG